MSAESRPGGICCELFGKTEANPALLQETNVEDWLHQASLRVRSNLDPRNMTSDSRLSTGIDGGLDEAEVVRSFPSSQALRRFDCDCERSVSLLQVA